jgi:glutamate-1-semialdehyde 2,1-aminomutase
VKSLALYDRALKATPGGSQTLSKQARRFPIGAHPLFFSRGDGAHVWDVDGNEYIDLICSLGATTVGYHHPVIEEAVIRQIRESGPSFSLPHPLETEVAEKLCGALLWPEQAKWFKTGSDACSCAVRAARAFTGRDVVLYADNGYHGTHDFYTVTRPVHPGVPEKLADLIEPFPYNDLAALECRLTEKLIGTTATIDQSGRWTVTQREVDPEPVALVILEPTLFTVPDPGYLDGVIRLAHEHGALVCFDETILGGRAHLGGGGAWFGVRPDLAVFGKALGGGYPIAALVGRRDVLECSTGYSGTFFGDAIGLAALSATLDLYEQEPLCGNQWRDGRAIMDTLQREADEIGLPIVLDGFPFHPRLTFVGDEDQRLMSTFLQECAERGVLWHSAGVNCPALLTREDLYQVCRALKEALCAVAAGEPLRGAVIEDAQIRPARAA